MTHKNTDRRYALGMTPEKVNWLRFDSLNYSNAAAAQHLGISRRVVWSIRNFATYFEVPIPADWRARQIASRNLPRVDCRRRGVGIFKTSAQIQAVLAADSVKAALRVEEIGRKTIIALRKQAGINRQPPYQVTPADIEKIVHDPRKAGALATETNTSIHFVRRIRRLHGKGRKSYQEQSNANH